jgi:lipoprotein-anchoring transpeptidase ErfK/SrfK
MEVLVTRQSRRLSRILVAILLLSFSVVALSFIYKMNHQPSQSQAAPISTPPAPVTAIEAPATPPATSLMPLPETAPATQPAPQVAPPSALPTPEPPRAIEAAYNKPTTLPTFSTSSLLADAQTKLDNGKFLEARGELNDALQSGSLSDSQVTNVKAMLSQIGQTVVFGPRRFPDDEFGGVYVVQPGDSLAKIALQHDISWEMLGRINNIDARHLRAGATIKLVEGPFFAVVSKKKFEMDLYLGGLPGEKSAMFVTSYSVGLGRDDSTPLGTWMVEPHRKLKHPTYYSPRGEGVIAADDPKNPLGGYWIGLTGTEGQAVGKMSYGIHGTIDPDSIGKQSSMGCIRMGKDDIPVVFDMMVEGKSMVVVQP